MECKEIVDTLSALPGLEVTTSNERVLVYVPAIDDNVHLLAKWFCGRKWSSALDKQQSISQFDVAVTLDLGVTSGRSLRR